MSTNLALLFNHNVGSRPRLPLCVAGETDGRMLTQMLAEGLA
jgi:hypothetical protein